MAVVYKRFEVWYIDPTSKAELQKAGDINFTYLSKTQDLASDGNYHDSAYVFNLFNTCGIDNEAIQGPIAWETLANVDYLKIATPNAVELLPNATGQSCSVKLKASNGYYALLSYGSVPSGAAAWGAAMIDFELYTDGGAYKGVMPFFRGGWNAVSFTAIQNFDGEFTTTSHQLIALSNSGENMYIFSYEYYTLYVDQQSWLTAIPDYEPTPPTPPDTDPYASIDGEGALPGGADVDLPAEPTLSALDAGMFALFAPSSSQMKSLASYLWTDFGGAGTDVVAMLGEVVEALKRTVANPLELVLGLSIIASQGLSKGGSSNVHVGFWDTGVSMTKLAKQYFTVDCGSITFNPVCGDTFLDYAPYSKFSIFLPYVGTKILDANDVVGHTISVKYRGDCVTGGLVCYLKRDGTIIAEFAGNCALNLPLSADSWGQTISGGLSIVAGAAGGAIKGGAAGAAAGAVASAASVATNPSVLSPQVEYTGAVAGGSGHMGSQKPFILREAVRFHSTSHFNTVTGYPSFYYRKLGDCTGFTQVVDVHMDGLSATGDELTEIESLLKGGVIL